MNAARPAEDFADYRFFRAIAVHSARFSVAGLFFIVWTLLWASGHRWQTSVFLGSTTVLLVVVSLGAAMTSYMLFKRRGGKVEKGPRSLDELMARSDPAREHERRDDVPHDEHQG